MDDNADGLSRDPLEKSSIYGVDVQHARSDFAELQRELSNANRTPKSYLSATQDPPSDKCGAKELEEAASPSTSSGEEPFDLEDTLRGNKRLEEESGIKHKAIGVIWDDLTVKGIGRTKIFVQTFPSVFIFPFKFLMGLFGKGGQSKEVDILHKFRGLLKPGEMVLVLGKPGAGCTTFLKVMANQRYGYTNIEGEVRYGPFSAAEFEKRYRGEAVYCEEDDIHYPTLTVGQTLGFALETKTPSKRPGGISAAQFKDKVVDLFLRMFEIEHTKNTIVGNPFVRGVSGGERKRVSIAEMMVTGASVCSHDNSTRGLDASTALDYTKSLRIMTNVYRTTTFVSLYQASENIYAQFDKVIVIAEGRQVFFGPAKEARSYFEGLGFLEKPRQATPDYLTGCTSEFEREYAIGRSRSDVPSTPNELVEAFEKSKYAQLRDEEMATWRERVKEEQQVYEDFKTAVIQGKRHASQGSVYSISFSLQIWALTKRQFILKWQDKFSLVLSWFTAIVIGIVIGTVWLQQPETSSGAFTRGGVIFMTLLFKYFQAIAELAGVMMGRPTMNKHRSYTFYRPSALWIAQIVVDLAFEAVQILVFSIVVYFMCGLVYNAGAFFTFYLLNISGYLAMTLFFRTAGCLCSDFNNALKFAATIITLFVVTSGFVIQYDNQQSWLSWIFYINALGLSFSGIMINEFKRLNLRCTGKYLVPYGPGYDDIAHRTCTLAGSSAGSAFVSGKSYVEAAFQYSPGDLWRNWGIIIALMFGFLMVNIFLSEYLKWGVRGRVITLYAKETEEWARLNQALVEKREEHNNRGGGIQGWELRTQSKAVFTWEDLCYDVPVASSQLRLLKNIFGYVKPGQLTALMGASGAGKTTLLDVLASRKTIGVVSGEKLVDGKPPSTAFQRSIGYAEQLDVHEDTQTVREALRFSAELRQPYETSREEKYAYVEEIISLLEMENIADAIIGTPEAGVSLEERKRVTIAVELAAKPELLLFLDEPTSGLDSQSAFNIVRILQKLAAAGEAILCTIHQPNSSLLENFDRLLLLQRGGETVYFGDIGKDASVLRQYFYKHGADCPASANPAEWMLDAISAGQTRRIGDKDWGEIWQDSEELAAVKEEIDRIKRQRIEEVGSESPVDQREFATPLWHQIKTVQARAHRSFWRSPDYGFTRLFNHVIIALLTGLMFLQLDESRTSLQYRIFIIFQATILPVLVLAQVELKYDLSRLIYYREAASKTYKQLAFALSMVAAEVPYSIIGAVGFFLPLYYIPGFVSESSRAGYSFLMILVMEFFVVTLGQMLSALTPNTFVAAVLNPFAIIIFTLFCGVTAPKPRIPGFWRAWLYQLDPFSRVIAGMVSTQLHNQLVTCKESELNHFTAPPGQTCGEYMANFFSAGGPGYVVNNGTSDCAYCAYRVGDQFYEPLGISFDNRWRDLGILCAFIGSNLILLFVGSRYLNFNKR